VQGRALLIDDGANDAGDDGQDQRAEHGPPEAVYKATDTEEAGRPPTGPEEHGAAPSQLPRRINSQLIIKVTNPSERIANGNDTKCTIGLMEALINAMNKANAAMPRIGGSPTGVMPGITATITAAAMVIISQLGKKLLMDLS